MVNFVNQNPTFEIHRQTGNKVHVDCSHLRNCAITYLYKQQTAVKNEIAKVNKSTKSCIIRYTIEFRSLNSELWTGRQDSGLTLLKVPLGTCSHRMLVKTV